MKEKRKGKEGHERKEVSK